MPKQTKDIRSKYWNKLVDILEKEFPKGKSKERGHALVLLAYAEMFLLKEEESYEIMNTIQQVFINGADSTGRVAQEVMAIKIKEIEGLVNEIGTGAFSTDHLEHANNTIEHAKEIAQKVLSILKEKR